MLKAHILFGDPDYLKMFNDAYNSIKLYIRNNDGLYLNVNMNTGRRIAYTMDGYVNYIYIIKQ